MKKKYFFIPFLFYVLIFAVACTKTIPIRSWTAPSQINITATIDHIIVNNPKKGSLLYDILEDSFRERLSFLPFISVDSSRNLVDLINQLKVFNFSAKVSENSRVAYLTYEVSEDFNVKRVQNTRRVSLRSCNYLRKRDPCQNAGQVTLREGKQEILYKQRVIIRLKDQNGNDIIPIQNIDRSYQRRLKVVPNKLLLRKKTSDLIVKEYTKQILPYRKHVNVTLLKGDSIAIEMIQKGAHVLALKRLEKLVREGEKTSENVYLQGLVFEIQGDLTGAREFYHQALLLGGENEVIQEAIERIENLI